MYSRPESRLDANAPSIDSFFDTRDKPGQKTLLWPSRRSPGSKVGRDVLSVAYVCQGSRVCRLRTSSATHSGNDVVSVDSGELQVERVLLSVSSKCVLFPRPSVRITTPSSPRSTRSMPVPPTQRETAPHDMPHRLPEMRVLGSLIPLIFVPSPSSSSSSRSPYLIEGNFPCGRVVDSPAVPPLPRLSFSS